jgi:glycosyltransferase involved in cell wall biosynthesis
VGVKVTIVHERFTEFTGSEQVVEQLAAIYPDAPIWAPVGNLDVVPAELRDRVHVTRLSALLRGGAGGYAHLLPALPVAMRRLPVGTPDVVLASHHAFASQVTYATTAPVVAYVHSPARWVWDPAMRSGEIGGAVGEAALAAFAAAFRPADVRAARRLTRIVANSTAVAERVRDWWGRDDAVVVPPPVDVDKYAPDASVPREDFFLMAGRLVPYKNPQLAIRAAQAAGKRLVICGDGRAAEDCRRIAGPGVELLGRVDDATQQDLMRRCAALLMPGVEDFGIVPMEAQATGAPVIALRAGGALDYVEPGRTGEFVAADAADPDAAWAQALTEFRQGDYDPAAIRRHAERFSPASFRAAMAEAVASAVR